MKWLASLLVALAGMIVVSPSATFAAPPAAVVIESISHKVGSETEEKLIFKLSGQTVPKIFTMKGDNPRLVIDFLNSTYTGKSVMPLVDGKLATNIRTGGHQVPEQKIRVVVDLAKQIPVRHTSNYSEADNSLIIELFPNSQEQLTKEALPVVKLEPAISQPPSTEGVVAKLVEERPLPPVFPAPEPAKKVVAAAAKQNAIAPLTSATAAAKTEVPQLLNVSFDDSSSKGEMVLFHLTSFQPPVVSAVEKDNPRVLCDFVGMDLGKGVEENIVAKGKYVERIVTSKLSKPDKLRVVLNLSPNRDYDLQQVFFKKDNLFILIVNELSPGKSANKGD